MYKKSETRLFIVLIESSFTNLIFKQIEPWDYNGEKKSFVYPDGATTESNEWWSWKYFQLVGGQCLQICESLFGLSKSLVWASMLMEAWTKKRWKFRAYSLASLKGWLLVELVLFFLNATKHPKHVSSKQLVAVEETLLFVTFLTVIRLFFLLWSFSVENCNTNFSTCFDLNLMSYSLEMRLKWWAP